MAYTSDGVGYSSLSAAFRRAADLDQVVHVCAGRHQLTDHAIGLAPDEGTGIPTLSGHADGSTVLVATGTLQELGARDDQPMLVENVAFEDSETRGAPDPLCTGDGCDEEAPWARVTPFDTEGELDGALIVSGQVTMYNVRFTGNRGRWGGAMSVSNLQATSLTLDRCVFERNEAVDETAGAAILLYTDPLESGGQHTANQATIISDNTDWGQGDDDNAPDDIAFASSDGDPYQPKVTVDASYRFDGVASFTCSGDTLACE